MTDIFFRDIDLANDLMAICEMITSKEELLLIGPHGNFPLSTIRLRNYLCDKDCRIVGELNNQIVSFCCLTELVKGRHASIGNVVVKLSHRNNGIGRKMLCFLIKKCFEKYNIKYITIKIFDSNQKAIALYKTLGFNQLETSEMLSGNQLVTMKLVKSAFK